MDNCNQLAKFLETEENKMDDCKFSYQRLNHINNIIQIKVLQATENVELYGDIKQFLNYYVLACEERNFSYYTLNKGKVLEMIQLVKLEERISLLRYFEKKINSEGIYNKNLWVSEQIKKSKIQYCFQNLSLRNFISGLFNAATYNWISLLFTLFLIYFLYSIVLLPAPHTSFHIFSPVFVKYSQNNLGNHFLNTLVSFCDIQSEFKINPIDFRGVIVEVLLKVLVLVLVLGFITDELKRKMHA